jgi:hypothetical protein
MLAALWERCSTAFLRTSDARYKQNSLASAQLHPRCPERGSTGVNRKYRYAFRLEGRSTSPPQFPAISIIPCAIRATSLFEKFVNTIAVTLRDGTRIMCVR